jgi:hypothetical protein
VPTVSAHWFTKGGKNLVEQEIGWIASPIYCALLGGGYAFNQDGPEAWSDVSGSEASGSGYTSGGIVIANRTVVIDTSTNEVRLMGDRVEWVPSSVTARGAVIYVNSGAKPLLGYVDFEVDRSSSEGLFRLTWPATGVLRTRAL